MTVSVKTVEKRIECDGATKIFPLAGLIFLSRTDLVVKFIAADGTVTGWTNGVQFNLSGDGTVATGVLTTTAVDAYPAGAVIYVHRETDDIQNQTFNEGAGFPAKNAENAYDRRTLRSQEYKAWLLRTVAAPDTDLPLDLTMPPAALRGGHLSAWDLQGRPTYSITTDALAALIGTVSAGKDGVVSFVNVAALRANVRPFLIAKLTGYDNHDDGGDSWLVLSANQAAADNGITVFVDASGTRYERTGFYTSQGVPTTWAGIKNDGQVHATNTARFQAAMNSGLPLQLAAGTTLVDLGVLSPPSGLRLRGLGNKRSILGSAANTVGTGVIVNALMNINMATGNSRSDIEISDIGVQSNTASCTLLACYGKVTDVTLRNIRASKCTICYTDSSEFFAGTTDNTVASNWILDGCTGIGDSANVTNLLPFIRLGFAHHMRVQNCGSQYYFNTIIWWGGDSNPAADGAVANTRKAHDMLISHCWAYDGNGGIWGSMGRNIRVVSPDVQRMTDVGVDFEGCLDCSSSDGKVIDCNNGNLTTFWYNRNISFDNMQSSSSTGAHPLFRTYNANQDFQNESVSINGGLFEALAGLGLIDSANGPARFLSVSGARLWNSVINFTANNLHDTTIENTKLIFTRAIPGVGGMAPIGVDRNNGDGLFAGHVVIRNNQIRSIVAQPNFGTAMAVAGSDANYATQFEVFGNHVEGFGTDINLIWNGANAGVKGRFLIGLNRFCGGVILTANLNGSTYTPFNNYNASNTVL